MRSRMSTCSVLSIVFMVMVGTAVSYAAARVTPPGKSHALDPNATLSDYLVFAAFNNPGLEAAFDRWKAGLERIPQARSLPDPRFSYRYFIREVETRVGPQRQAFELSQMMPWFGKLDLAGNVAAQAAQADYHAYEGAKRSLFLEVKNAYYDLYFLGRSLAVTREHVNLLIHLDEVVRARYRAAAASQPDMIKVQVELGKLEDRLKTLRDLAGPTKARLNAALNRPVTALLEIPMDISLPERALSEEALFDRLDRTHPKLLALSATAHRHRLATDLAKKAYRPDLTVGLSYVEIGKAPFGATPADSGQDVVSAAVSLNIPLWHKRLSARVREHRLRQLSAQQERQDLTNRLHARLKLDLYHLRDAQRKRNLYGDTLLPKAQEALTATEAAFRNSSGSFLELIDAQRVTLEFQLAHARAGADHGRSLAAVEFMVGELSGPHGISATSPDPY